MTATVTQMRDREPVLARAAIWDKALEILAKDDARLAHVFDDATVNRVTESHWQIITDDAVALALPPPVMVAMIRQATLHVTPALYGKHAGDPFWPYVEVVSRDLLDGEDPTIDPQTLPDEVASYVREAGEVAEVPFPVEDDTKSPTTKKSLEQIRDALKVSVTLLDEEIERLEDE